MNLEDYIKNQIKKLTKPIKYTYTNTKKMSNKEKDTKIIELEEEIYKLKLEIP